MRNKPNFHIDVRTKLFLIVITSLCILKMSYWGVGLAFMLFPVIIPFVLLLMYRLPSKAFLYLGTFAVMSVLGSGVCGAVVMGIFGMFTRLLPIGMIGYIFFATTKVGECTAAMDKMKIPMCISIPIAVLFRFFPTLKEEYSSISNAMKMRGIRFGGKCPDKMLEYRMIPFLMSGMRIGDELSAAALTRGLGAPITRTSLEEQGFGIWDIIILVPSIGILILFCAIEFNIV